MKDKRRTHPVTAGPGGVVADYVPWYFNSRSPMMYSIARGNVVTYHGGQEPLVYLCSTVEAVVESALPFAFSDRHPIARYADFHSDLGDLDREVDWAVIAARIWASDDAEPDRMHLRMAEFLVHQTFPMGLVTQLTVRTPAMKARVDALLAGARVGLPCTVEPAWYFEGWP